MRPEERLGCLIGATFGLVYVMVNAGVLAAPAATAVRGAGIAAYLAVLVALWRAGVAPGPGPGPADGTAPRPRFARGYWAIVAAEVVAGAAGLLVLRVLDAPEAGVAWISVVVGVHFVGLAVLWREPSLRWVGAAITVCGLAGLVWAATAGAAAAPVAIVGGVVPGALLLAGSGWAAVAGRRRRPASTAA